MTTANLSFFSILRGEVLKTRRTRGFLLAVLGPIVVTLIVVGFHLENAPTEAQEASPWKNFIRYTFNFYLLLYPLFAALIGFMLSNIEHKNGGFKYLFALPAPKSAFYFSKVLILMGWLGFSLVLAYLAIYGMGHALGGLLPNYAFNAYNPPPETIIFLFRQFINLFSIVAIHFFLSLYFDNFIIGVGSAAFLIIFGAVGANHRLAYLLPYAYSVLDFQGFMGGTIEWIDKKTWISLAYGAAFFIAGFWLVSTKNIK